MAKYLARIVILSTQVVGRAFMKTLRQEYEAFQEAARIHQANSNSSPYSGRNDMSVKGMTLLEARQILNVKDLGDQKTIDTHYQHLFQANEKPSGGTFYLQSKVFRAKERIDQELAKRQAASTSRSPSTSSSVSSSTSTSRSPAGAQFQAKKPGQESR